METQLEIIDLNEAEQKQADEILRQQPKLAAAINEYAETYLTTIGKLRTVMVELRKAPLSPKEQRLVLRRCGFNDARISEIQKIVNDKDEAFNAFIAGTVSFRLALQQARATRPSGANTEASAKLLKFASDTVNAFAGPWPKKRCKVTVERLDCRVTIIFAPIKVRRAAKPSGAKPHAKKPAQGKDNK